MGMLRSRHPWRRQRRWSWLSDLLPNDPTALKRRDPRSLRLEPCEERRLLAVGPQLITVGSAPGVFIQDGQTLRESPRELELTFDDGQIIDPDTLGGIQLVRAGFDGEIGGANDVAVSPGFAGIGDTPNRVVLRFASTLPDDQYRLTLFGSGPQALTNAAGQAFNDGVTRQIQFDIDLGAQVVAVVPQPVSRQSGETIVPLANPSPGTGRYGAALAAFGDNLAVGDPLDDENASDPGAVYVLGPTGNVIRKLTSPAPGGGGQFGAALAATASRVVVGAPGAAPSGIVGAGAVHVFNSSGLLVDSLLSTAPHSGENFGSSVAISGNLVAVGAPHHDIPGFDKTGAVTLFDLGGGSPLVIVNPEPGVTARFGTSVALSGSQLLVGAIGGPAGGKAYLFNLDGSLVRTIVNPGGGQNDEFGTSVAFLGDRLLVGAPYTDAGSFDSGAAYVLANDGTVLATLEPPVPQVSQHFGRSIAAVGGDVLVGAPLKNLPGGGSAGAGYLFSTTGQLKRSYENPSPSDGTNFGWAVDRKSVV